MGRVMIAVGLVLVIAGLAFERGGRLGLGHLPGDISVESERWSFHFPIMTCLVLSVVLSAVMWFASRFWR